MQAATDGVGARAGAEQVAALEQRERLGVGDAAGRRAGGGRSLTAAHALGLRLEEQLKTHQVVAVRSAVGGHRHAADLVVPRQQREAERGVEGDRTAC